VRRDADNDDNGLLLDDNDSQSDDHLTFNVLNKAHGFLMDAHSHGQRLRGTGGTVPLKFEVGTAHASVPPNILRSTVFGCEAKYELTKKRCQGGIYFV